VQNRPIAEEEVRVEQGDAIGGLDQQLARASVEFAPIHARTVIAH
jgi:hypothetical protein